MIHLGGTVHYLCYTIFYFVSYFLHYTGSYTGRVAVVAILFPILVSTSCSTYVYCIYISLYCLSISYWSAGSTGTVSRTIRNLREHLSSGADFV